MEIKDIKKIIRNNFPTLTQSELVDFIATNGIYMYVPSNQYILEVGNIIKVIPLVIKGSVKVIRQEAKGEIFLYYIRPGESCAVTLSSCLKREKSRVKALVQEDTELIALPVECVYDMHRNFQRWQDFVIETYNLRLEEIMSVLDDIVFHKMEERLSNYLSKMQKTFESNDIIISHQEVADDLATSREVISRLLKQMEQQQLVALSRGKISILNSLKVN